MNATATNNNTLPCFIGIDLHSNNAVICIKEIRHDAAKGIFSRVLATKTISIENGAERLMAFLEPYCEGKPHKAVVESTFNWYFLADAFESRNWNLFIADPSTVSQANLKASDDKSDAAYLAERLSCNSIKHYEPLKRDDRALRDLCRHRLDLMQKRAEFKITIVNLYRNQLSRKVRADELFRNIEDKSVDGCFEPEWFPELKNYNVQLRVATMMENIHVLNRNIERVDERIQQECKEVPLAKLCKTMPGCGPVLSSIIATEIGTIKRFKSAADFVSYCRLCSTSKLSNGKSKGMGNAKNGNAYLSWALTEVANLAIRFSEVARKTYERLLNKAGGLRVKAIRTLAAKIARGLYQALSKGKPFNIAWCLCGINPEAVKEPA